jgi:hypothetical protein
LLRRHETGRAGDRARARELRVRRRRDRGIGFGLRQLARDPPIDHERLAERSDEDVGRLDVAVHDAARVRECDGVTCGEHVRDQRESRLELVFDQLVERTAVDPAHHVERRAVGGATRVVNRHDTGMLELRRDPRFTLEAREIEA